MKKSTKLALYLKKKDISLAQLALEAKTFPQNLHNLIKGRDIKLSIACRIEKATGGEVTCQDLFKDYVEPNL